MSLKTDLNTGFVKLDGNTPAGVALNTLLSRCFIVVETTDPASRQKRLQVLKATALVKADKNTPLKDLKALPTDTSLRSRTSVEEARSRVKSQPQVAFLVLDDNGEPQGVMETDDRGLIQVKCPHCQKWVYVPGGAGEKECPNCWRTFYV